MPYLLVRQKFEEYSRWRAAFDSLAEERREAGMKLVVVTRNMADPNEAVVLFEFTDQDRMRVHASSGALRGAHERGGVVEEGGQMLLLVDAEDVPGRG